MKKAISILLLFAMVAAVFAGCAGKQGRPVSCDEVIAAYEAAGYQVYHREYPEKDYGYSCCIEIDGEDGDHISFHFFDTAVEAESYAEERQWNWAVWLISVAMQQPTWLTTVTHYNIEIEYDSKDLYKPFEQLIES